MRPLWGNNDAEGTGALVVSSEVRAVRVVRRAREAVVERTRWATVEVLVDFRPGRLRVLKGLCS